MLTAAGDEKKSAIGFDYVKTSATALIYIGIARFLVSIIFYLVQVVTT